MFANHVWTKFDIFGYTFTKCGKNIILRGKDGSKICEIDAFLENGEYVMALEVKSRLEIGDVNDHLERLEKIRGYMNEHNDERKLLGAIAAGYYKNNEKNYAEKNGLYVLLQTGDSVDIVEQPGAFKAKIW
jgi:hypothetical protein